MRADLLRAAMEGIAMNLGLALVLLVVTTLGPTGVAPFIYYRF